VSRCILHSALRRVEGCPGAGCPFWSAGEDTCVLRDVELEIRSSPSVAEYLLELRATLEAAGPAATR